MLTKNTIVQPKSIGLEGVLLIVLLVFTLFLAPADTQTLPNVQPALLAMVDTQPDTNVRVIVQKLGDDSSLERLITEMEGTVVRDLRLINALAVELPAKAIPTLARSASVAQISLDGEMVSASTLTETVRDEFSSTSFSNNDGSQNWASDWIENGESNGPDDGDLRIDDGYLRIKDDDNSLRRAVDLTGAVSATLSFDYRRYGLDSSSDYIAIEVSADGGASWVELDRFAGGSNNDSNFQPASYDIVAYASAHTAIRFSTSSSLGSHDYLYVDNIQIESTSDTSNPPPPVETPGAGAITIRDEFNNVAYNNNDGSDVWSSDWIEIGESDGPSTGNIKVRTDGALELANYNNSLHRAVDLSGAETAVLSLEYRRYSMQTSNELSLEISADGGGSWTELDRFVGTGTDDADFLPASYDILPYASADTIIRFVIYDTNMGWNDYLYIDSIQIAYTKNIVIPPNLYLDTLNVQPVWDKGIQGQGITIAVVDSGLSPEDDFDGRISTRVGFNGDAQTNDDGFGHGTHVSGIIAGSYTGIAPQANLIGLKVSDDTGMAYESDTVAALQWIFENKDAYNIRVVNLSLNSSLEQSYNDSPLDAAVEILWLNDIVVVASAGNAWGPHNTVKAAPANDPFIITVGASEEGGTSDRNNDWVADFTQHGDTLSGFRKPEVIAPGKDIISVLASSSSWKNDYPERYVDGGYFRISGTSMAAPMVSGAVALLLQAEPNLTPDQVKYRLMNTGSNIYFNGAYPYLDVYDLLTTPTTESANADAIPHELLAKMALIAYWASQNDDENIDWATVDWDAVNWDAVDWNSVNWGSVNWGSVNWGSVNWGSVNWGSVNWGSVNWGSVNWGSVNWGSVNWGSVNWGSVNWGSVSWDD